MGFGIKQLISLGFGQEAGTNELNLSTSRGSEESV